LFSGGAVLCSRSNIRSIKLEERGAQFLATNIGTWCSSSLDTDNQKEITSSFELCFWAAAKGMRCVGETSVSALEHTPSTIRNREAISGTVIHTLYDPIPPDAKNLSGRPVEAHHKAQIGDVYRVGVLDAANSFFWPNKEIRLSTAA
jgi:hypothetical protein